jgi:hypothetical protein
MLEPVEPLLQVIVPPVQPTAVKVAFSPSQHTVFSVLITGAGGNGLPKVNVTLAVTVHELASVTTTE